MTSKNNSCGGYVGELPVQNSSACPGAHSSHYREERQRSANWPGGLPSLVSTYTSGTFDVVSGFTTSFTALPFSQSIVGNGGVVELRTIASNTLIKSWTLTDGATSGTDWSISGSDLNLTVPGSATVSLATATTIRTTVPIYAVRTTDNFQLSAAQTVDGSVVGYGTSQSAAAGSAKAIYQLNSSSPSGNYWIKNVDGSTARQLYCDMSTDGGGWTRWFNQTGVNIQNAPSQAIANYNLSSFDTSTSHYSAAVHRKARADSHSSGGRLDYLLEQTTGNYKMRVRGLMEGDPGANNRNAANISNIDSGQFDFGWFNSTSTPVGWPGYNNSSTTYCVSSQNIHPFLSGNSGWNNGYFQVFRGYQSDPGTSNGCGDHCGNIRRYWFIMPGTMNQENCYSGYYTTSNISGTGTFRCYYREVGTLGSGSL